MLWEHRTPPRTRAPASGRPVLLYDGHCAFCTREVQRLERRARGRVDIDSFRGTGVLDRYPGVTHEACMREIKLVDSDGAVYGGAEAIVRSLQAGGSLAGRLAGLYFLSIVRPVADEVYAFVARRRYRITGGRVDDCAGGACGRHAH